MLWRGRCDRLSLRPAAACTRPEKASSSSTSTIRRSRLVIIGAVHIAQALIPIARGAPAMTSTVIDPRGAFATRSAFPGRRRFMPNGPTKSCRGSALDPRTAMVALTHDPKIDDPALIARAAVAGASTSARSGSKKTQATRLERLQAAGFTTTISRASMAPIGLDIGARGPAEIAISIMAEMTTAFCGSEQRRHEVRRIAAVSAAEGAILAHSVKHHATGVFKKGRVLIAARYRASAASGVGQVFAARLDADDVPEDEAAAQWRTPLPGADVRRRSHSPAAPIFMPPAPGSGHHRRRPRSRPQPAA